MFSSLLLRVSEEIETVKCALAACDLVRETLFPAVADPEECKREDNAFVTALRKCAPSAATWKVIDHCAAFTRLYAVYECFVFDLVKEWLRLLPELYRTYEALPPGVKDGHRTGVAEILARLGGDRYAHLSEEAIIRGIYRGLSNAGSYDLLSDAFLIDDQNLRRDALSKLMSRVGIPDSWKWVSEHYLTQRFMLEVRGDTETPESELRSFVQYRNEAAHGVVASVLGREEIGKIAEFVGILCTVLAELVSSRIVSRRVEIGTAAIIGQVIRQFRDNVIGVKTVATTLAVGDEVYAVRSNGCYAAQLLSIEVKHRGFLELRARDGEEVGMRLTLPVKAGAKLVKLQPKGYWDGEYII